MTKNRKYLIFAFIFVFVVVALVLTLFELKQQQETRSKAGRGDAVSFSLSPSSATKNVNDTFDVDLYIDANNQSISGFDVRVNFNKDLLEVSNPQSTAQAQFDTPLVVNVNNQTGVIRIAAVQSTGVVQVHGQIKLGTVSVRTKALGTALAGLQAAQVVGTGQNQSSGLPVNGIGNNLGTYTISTGPTTPPVTVTQGPTSPPVTITQGPTVTVNPSITVTQPPGSTQLSFDVRLTGIGEEGGGNRNPRTRERSAKVQILDGNNRLVGDERNLTLTYNQTTGRFTGSVNLGNNFQTGQYLVKIRTFKYLWKRIPGIPTITRGTNNQIAQVVLVLGDTNSDNKVNIEDFNNVINCYGSKSTTSSCVNKDAADLDDNDTVDGVDHQWMIIGLRTREGD